MNTDLVSPGGHARRKEEQLVIDRLFKSMGSIANLPSGVLGWSDDFKKYYSSGYCCPHCGERLFNKLGISTLMFYSDRGERLPLWRAGALLAKSAECPICHYRFDLRSVADSHPAVPLVATVVETERRQEPIGSDINLIDNAKSSVTIRRTFNVTKEWSRSYTVENDTSSKVGLDVNAGLTGVGSIQATCESTLAEKYINSESRKDVYSDTVSVDVPGLTTLKVIIQWKHIIQMGHVELRVDGQTITVPFEAVVGMTFDQQQFEGKE